MKLADGISKDEKKLVRKMFWRSMTMYASVNPVTMGGGGFAYSMMPFINHFYKSEEDRAAALERHTQYFSTTIPCASFVIVLGSLACRYRGTSDQLSQCRKYFGTNYLFSYVQYT